jgi:FG-GAP-like repeat/FG-GAP repeat
MLRSTSVMRPRVRNQPHRRRLRRVVVALVVLVVSSVAPALSATPDDGWLAGIVTNGREPSHVWMRRSAWAGFRDLGPLVGLSDASPSYSVSATDMNGDGWTDLVIGRHGRMAVLLLTEVEADTASRFVTSWRFRDELHHRVDRHGCAVSDVDLDGLRDVYCVKGAQLGTAKKWNELWIHGRDGTFMDRAADHMVEDVWGRGRFPAFLDLNHDRWPDLFVGNDATRADGRPTPNRTFVGGAARFTPVRLGLTREIGARCVDVADLDGNGWDDVVVCGADRLYLFRRFVSGFHDATEDAGLPRVEATAARSVDLDGDGTLDLVYTQTRTVTIALQGRRHRFSVALRLPLRQGHGLAVGDPDGDGDTDVYVVEGCLGGRDMPDWLLRSVGDGRFAPERVAAVNAGCGDTAAAIDFDRDGMDEFVVLNGGGAGTAGHRGPEQLLTLGDWRPSGQG